MRCDNCGETIIGEPYPVWDRWGKEWLVCSYCFGEEDEDGKEGEVPTTGEADEKIGG